MRPLLLLLLVLAPSIALAEDNPPAAAAVADKIGQDIEFQDEVKAVSFSRSTDGYYLSFGAPYPKQVLSVWTDEKTYDQLPFTQKLVGRTVRIRGKLEQSPTGPLLKLTSLDQLAVVETDEAIITQAVLDGRHDRNRFKAAVSQNLARDDFQTLETLAGELLQSREQSADGALLINCFLNAFAVPVNAPDEDFAFLESKLAAWSRSRPWCKRDFIATAPGTLSAPASSETFRKRPRPFTGKRSRPRARSWRAIPARKSIRATTTCC